MQSCDFCLAWNWEYDRDFVGLLDQLCREKGISFLQVTPSNLRETLLSLEGNRVGFRVFLDRASEADSGFTPLAQWARSHAVYRINPYELASRTWDKAAMHLNLIGAGLYTPHTIFLPSSQEKPSLAPLDLSPLGVPFTIKPAHGSGGEGVIPQATSWEQVLIARQKFPADRYLLQAHIVPVQLGGRPAWFRVIYCAGQIYPCWWDTRTHAYRRVTREEESRFFLSPLRAITASIARLCGLESFSTEIALAANRLFVVVDYVNDQIDFRLQSKAADGVPDEIVWESVSLLVAIVVAHCPPSPPPSASRIV